MAFDLNGLDSSGAALVAQSNMSAFDWSYLNSMQTTSQAAGSRALFTNAISNGQTVDDVANTAAAIQDEDNSNSGSDAYQISKQKHDQVMAANNPAWMANKMDNAIPGSTVNPDGSRNLPVDTVPDVPSQSNVPDGYNPSYLQGGASTDPNVPYGYNPAYLQGGESPTQPTQQPFQGPGINPNTGQSANDLHQNLIQSQLQALMDNPPSSQAYKDAEARLQSLYATQRQIPVMQHNQPDQMASLLSILTNVLGGPNRFSANVAAAPIVGQNQRDQQQYQLDNNTYNQQLAQDAVQRQGAAQDLAYEQGNLNMSRQDWLRNQAELQNQLATEVKAKADAHKEYLAGLQHFSDENATFKTNNDYTQADVDSFNKRIQQWAVNHGEDPNEAMNLVQQMTPDPEGDDTPDLKDQNAAYTLLLKSWKNLGDANQGLSGEVTPDTQKKMQAWITAHADTLKKYGLENDFAIPDVGTNWRKTMAGQLADSLIGNRNFGQTSKIVMDNYQKNVYNPWQVQHNALIRQANEVNQEYKQAYSKAIAASNAAKNLVQKPNESDDEFQNRQANAAFAAQTLAGKAALSKKKLDNLNKQIQNDKPPALDMSKFGGDASSMFGGSNGILPPAIPAMGGDGDGTDDEGGSDDDGAGITNQQSQTNRAKTITGQNTPKATAKPGVTKNGLKYRTPK